MGVPTRLHGVATLNVAKIKKACPKCVSIQEWEVIKIKGKYYKRCTKCELKIEVKDPKTIKEIKNSLSKNKKMKSKSNNQKRAKKKKRNVKGKKSKKRG